jgi:hypothetical protein
MENKEKEITWEELWEKCNPKKKELSYEDKVLDWDLERIWFEKNKDLK